MKSVFFFGLGFVTGATTVSGAVGYVLYKTAIAISSVIKCWADNERSAIQPRTEKEALSVSNQPDSRDNDATIIENDNSKKIIKQNTTEQNSNKNPFRSWLDSRRRTFKDVGIVQQPANVVELVAADDRKDKELTLDSNDELAFRNIDDEAVVRRTVNSVIEFIALVVHRCGLLNCDDDHHRNDATRLEEDSSRWLTRNSAYDSLDDYQPSSRASCTLTELYE